MKRDRSSRMLRRAFRKHAGSRATANRLATTRRLQRAMEARAEVRQGNRLIDWKQILERRAKAREQSIGRHGFPSKREQERRTRAAWLARRARRVTRRARA